MSVVTSVRSSTSTRLRISSIRSSIWFLVSRTSTSGSTTPVGRTICSTTRLEWLLLEVARGGRHEHDLARALQELVEGLGPVVERARQPEAVVHQRLLARAVALVHAADLGHRLVRLVDEADEVVGEEVEQAVGPRAGLAPVEDARVVLDPVAEAELAQHLHVELRALAQPVRLEQLALLLELLAARLELVADLHHGALDRVAVGGVVGGGPDRGVVELLQHLAAERVELLQRLDLVAEEDGAVGGLGVGGEDLERLAAHAEAAATEHAVVARVLDVDELAQHCVAVGHLAALEHQHQAVVLLGRAQAEDAGHAGHHDHVAAAEQRGGGRVAQPLDLLVDRGVLLDVEVLRRDVGLGLVVVVVRDEVLDRVLREELAELVAELRGQRLVVGDHQRGSLDLLDREGHRGRLARAGHAEQRLEAIALLDALSQAVASLGLIGDGAVGGVYARSRAQLRD